MLSSRELVRIVVASHPDMDLIGEVFEGGLPYELLRAEWAPTKPFTI